MRKILSLFLFLFLAQTYVSAQQLPLFTQYREYFSILNPAIISSDYIADEYDFKVGLSYRMQWVKKKNTPRTAILQTEYFWQPDERFRAPIGGYIINDRTGPTGFTGVYGRLGGVLSNRNEDFFLSLGVNFGFVQHYINGTTIKFLDAGDTFGEQDHRQTIPDVGAGVYFFKKIGRYDDGFYVGASIPQVLGLDLTFRDANTNDFTINRIQHYYMVLGLMKFLDDRLIEPSIWVKYVPNAPLQIDFNFRWALVDVLFLGVGTTVPMQKIKSQNGDTQLTGTTFHAEVSYVIEIDSDRALKIGYGFDNSFKGFGPSFGSSHEINVAYLFGTDGY